MFVDELLDSSQFVRVDLIAGQELVNQFRRTSSEDSINQVADHRLVCAGFRNDRSIMVLSFLDAMCNQLIVFHSREHGSDGGVGKWGIYLQRLLHLGHGLFLPLPKHPHDRKLSPASVTMTFLSGFQNIYRL